METVRDYHLLTVRRRLVTSPSKMRSVRVISNTGYLLLDETPNNLPGSLTFRRLRLIVMTFGQPNKTPQWRGHAVFASWRDPLVASAVKPWIMHGVSATRMAPPRCSSDLRQSRRRYDEAPVITCQLRKLAEERCKVWGTDRHKQMCQWQKNRRESKLRRLTGLTIDLRPNDLRRHHDATYFFAFNNTVSDRHYSGF